jgi:hypothetical protein
MNVSDIWQLGAQIIHAQSTHADGLCTDASLTSDLCGVEWEAWRTLLRPPMLPPDLSHLQPFACAGKTLSQRGFSAVGI